MWGEVAVSAIVGWQKVRTLAQASGWCLGATRTGIKAAGMRLPWMVRDYALWNFRRLKPNPAKYGWRQVKLEMIPGYYLVYFRNCGIKGSRELGHIAVLHLYKEGDVVKGKLYADTTRIWSQWWANRIVAAYVPA